MNPIRNVLEIFRVKKTIRYYGSLESLEKILEKMETKPLDKEEFHLQKTNKCQYILHPTISLGTMQYEIGGMISHTDKITVAMTINSKNTELQEIQMLGVLHKVHVLIFIGFLICLIASIYVLISSGKFEPLIIVSMLWPIIHIWFNFVWTSQEKALIQDVKLALHMRIRTSEVL